MGECSVHAFAGQVEASAANHEKRITAVEKR